MTEINKKIDEVIVKVWEMSDASQEPIVRQETLKWARKELHQLFPQPLDKELRKRVARILHKMVRQFEVEGCLEVFRLEVHIDQILALLPDIEEAIKQERERIMAWGSEDCPHVNQGTIKHTLRRECESCWQALKESK